MGIDIILKARGRTTALKEVSAQAIKSLSPLSAELEKGLLNEVSSDNRGHVNTKVSRKR